jgi:hypothetical protein
LVQPGGHIAVCVLGRFCLWETIWYLLHGNPRNAFRRWRSGRLATSLNIRVNHFSVRQIERAFHPEFTMIDWRGIGVAVPPSYVTNIPDRLLRAFGGLDRCVDHWPLLRALADHRLMVFVRNRSR